jgi:hypothetical protein
MRSNCKSKNVYFYFFNVYLHGIHVNSWSNGLKLLHASHIVSKVQNICLKGVEHLILHCKNFFLNLNAIDFKL